MDLGQRLARRPRFRDQRGSFNPCCRGSWSTAIRARFLCSRGAGFNPCCRGSWSTAFRCSLHRRLPHDVSILVVVDLGQRPNASLRSSTGEHLQFQSLLSWISLNGGRSDCLSDRWPVSILVVVDLGQRRSTGIAPSVRSCIDVSILVVVDLGQRRAAYQPASSNVSSRFQSLLLWISVNGRLATHLAVNLADGWFQSLLSWISVNGLWRVDDGAKRFDVSILVVVDLGQRQVAATICWSSSGFNPCCRGSRSTATGLERCRTAPRGSFNPCCRGSRSTAARRTEPRPGSVIVFQSLLLWISVNGYTGHQRMLASPVQSFNPCCRGSRSTALSSPMSQPLREVSILVVVDLGQRLVFEQRCCPPGNLRSEVSILVVVDLGQRRR